MKVMSCRRRWLGVLLSAALLAPWLNAAAQNRGAIAGKVVDFQGQTLAGVAVAVSKAEDNSRTGLVLTDGDGRYRFVSITFGKYRLSLKKDGYTDSTSGLIELQSETVELNFTLQPASPASSNAGGLVRDDQSENEPGLFAASGVAGATAPSGYSAGAASDDSELVMARMGSLQESDLSLLPAGGTVPDCSRESDLVAAARMHPGSFRSHHDLGVFYAEHGEWSQGLTYLRLASVDDPWNATNARWLALAYVRTNQVRTAIVLIRGLVMQRSSDADLALLLAQLYSVAGDRLHAISGYLQAAQLDGGDVHLLACGFGLLSANAPEKASPLFSRAVARHPDSGRLWMGLGVAQDLGDDKPEAVRSLLRAADEDPDYLPTYFFLAALSGTSIERDPQILKRLEVLVAAHPESAEAHYDYALSLWKHQRLDPAAGLNFQTEEQLKLTIAKDPAFFAAHLKLGTMYQATGDQAEAAKELKRAVQLDPGSATAHYRLAQVYRHMNQAALADLELAQFKRVRRGPWQQDDITQRLLLYAPGLSGSAPLGASCQPAR